MPTRRYDLKERARRQEQTRRRIVDATVALHREVGPARTTIAEVARRAGVGRVTVYNHFPDEAALLGACSAQFVAESPPPDPTRWAAIADAGERTRAALTELYAYYRANADMIANVSRDAALIPALAKILSASAEHQDAMRAALAGRRASRARRAAIGLALAFATWQQLTHAEGLSDMQAATLMATTIANA